MLGAILASLIFFYFTRQRRNRRPMLDMRGSSGELRPTPYIDTHLGLRSPYSPLGMHDDTMRSGASSRPLMRHNSLSSHGVDTANLASTGYPAEPFDPSSVSTINTTRPQESSAGTVAGTHAASSPPISPQEGPARSERDGRSQVYVVHHDGGRAPVTIMTSDGAEVVELPPGYGAVPESSRQQAVAESWGRGG
jgi:hypothetical protein